MTKAIVLGGKTGLLGQSLVQALEEKKWDVSILDRRVCDILDRNQVEKFIDNIQPDFVFNAIAYTQVDLAEDEKEAAFLINKSLVQNLALILAKTPSVLVHYSTDFVFSGSKTTPYTENDTPNPLNIYGASKLAGEQHLEQAKDLNYLLLRVSWLFGQNKKNFVSTIINKALEMSKLTVVHDQVGSPSYTQDIALASYELLQKNARGLFHFCNSGQASWCELASEAIKIANIDCNIQAIAASEYPHKAVRPKYSVLNTQKYKDFTQQNPRSWTNALSDYIFNEFLAKK